MTNQSYRKWFEAQNKNWLENDNSHVKFIEQDLCRMFHRILFSYYLPLFSMELHPLFFLLSFDVLFDNCLVHPFPYFFILWMADNTRQFVFNLLTFNQRFLFGKCSYIDGWEWPFQRFMQQATLIKSIKEHDEVLRKLYDRHFLLAIILLDPMAFRAGHCTYLG